MPITGLLPNCPYGWPSVFYVIGFISILMCIIWFIYAAESPTTHKTISVEESNFIIKSLGEMKYKKVLHKCWKLHNK